MTATNPAFSAASISENFARTREQIARTCIEAGRQPDDVILTAVSKTQSPEALSAALAVGQKVFGENRVQEAYQHWAHQREGLELRLIGPLQTNKSEDAVKLFDVIETLDREKLAKALADAMAKSGRSVRVLVQVNTGAEPQKAGVMPQDADALIETARMKYGLAVEGVMCIPPVDEDPVPHFQLLKNIADRNGLAVISMGMSGDFEAAIRCGATHVRVGSALFGARNPAKTG
ncbi:YggS family pyridoxal phosphate-dependent enzyme [Brevundimonas pishanensis]|uniref:YggS family pyridoxal phosphate-dependent enzyme n=1 Tax=Brevundimonas pishanensis TaxID=2896315 RepID=UPI001FA7B8A8|nr:YggS family pyridoxal phosphate-dependent enzyme [Brevundimonas pishanensis]